MNDKTIKFKARLIQFSIDITTIVESLPNSKSANYLRNQLLRSGLSPALNYGEAQFAESRKDFIHKLRICLKELNETEVNLEIIDKKCTIHIQVYVKETIQECNELISIFVKSIETLLKQKR